MDNSATTKPYSRALKKYSDISKNCFGNPSSLHRLGFHAERELKESRLKISHALDARGGKIIFTGSGTESNNLAIRGLANLRTGSKIVITDSEHPAVMETSRQLEAMGFNLKFIPTKGGELDLDVARQIIDRDTALVCTMLVNNESGAVYKVNEIGDIVSKSSNAGFHVDAVQAFGKIPFSAASLRCNTLAISAHKLGGTKGVGALYISEGTRLSPIVFGGGQEQGLRSGTENVAGISAFGEAVTETFENFKSKLDTLKALREYGIMRLTQMGGVINQGVETAPHIINFSIPGALAEPMLHILEEDGVYVSVGSACSSKKKQRSHVLLAMGVDPKLIDCAIRVSFSFETGEADIEALIRGLEKGKRMLIR